LRYDGEVNPKDIYVCFTGSVCTSSRRRERTCRAPGQQHDAEAVRFDFVRAAKFDAWSEIKGTSAEDAMQQYIDLVASLGR
jgi:Acyl CoA binding protein